MRGEREAAAAAAAMRRGDHAEARKGFEAAIAAGLKDAAAFLGLALASRGLGDAPAAEAAVDLALKADARSLRALLLKADLLAERGQRRAATAHYASALAIAPDIAGAPPEVRAAVEAARRAHAALQAELAETILSGLRSRGVDPARASRRFADSIDMLSGRKRRYEQEPRSYFLPGLPTIEVFPREAFPWIEALERRTSEIRAELEPLLSDPAAFRPYIEDGDGVPTDREHSLLNDQAWTACYLWRDGKRVEPWASRCPRTVEALSGIDLETVPGRAPFALFSKLTPGAWIRPHTGYLNTRLVVHLPLIVPEGCRFRVGNSEIEWKEGQALAFDDTIEHEARNDGAGTRVVLIFNVWRPELTTDERDAVSALLQAVDAA